jgi:hypothetical protein
LFESVKNIGAWRINFILSVLVFHKIHQFPEIGLSKFGL